MKVVLAILHSTAVLCLITVAHAFTPLTQRNQFQQRLTIVWERANHECSKADLLEDNNVESFDISDECRFLMQQVNHVDAVFAVIDSVERAQRYVHYWIAAIIELEEMTDLTGKEPEYIDLKNNLASALKHERRLYQLLKPVMDRAMDPPLPTSI